MRWYVFLLCCTLYIQFRLVRFCLLLDYIKLALFLFLFITDFHGYVHGWTWTSHYYAECHQGGYFLCRHLHCHFHHCVVIFSHSMMMLKYIYRNKVLYRSSRPLSNTFFHDDLSIRCWRRTSNGYCLSFSLKWLHRLNSLHICKSWITLINKRAVCIIGHLYIERLIIICL